MAAYYKKYLTARSGIFFIFPLSIPLNPVIPLPLSRLLFRVEPWLVIVKQRRYLLSPGIVL